MDKPRRLRRRPRDQMERKRMNDLTTIAAETEAFYRDPNAVCPFSNGRRDTLATSIYGTEILSYQAVRDGFRDKRMLPRNVDYFRRIGASELILEFIRASKDGIIRGIS